MDLDDVIARARRGEVDPSDVIYLADEARRLTRDEAAAWEAVDKARASRDALAEALHELECGFWATGTVPEMMENVRAIVRAAVDKADPPAGAGRGSHTPPLPNTDGGLRTAPPSLPGPSQEA